MLTLLPGVWRYWKARVQGNAVLARVFKLLKPSGCLFNFCSNLIFWHFYDINYSLALSFWGFSSCFMTSGPNNINFYLATLTITG